MKLIINPKRTFEAEIPFESNYDVRQWIKDGCSQELSVYRMAEKRQFTLSSRNYVTVAATIQRDKEEGRTDCFYFFRYMNSGLMRRIFLEERKEANFDNGVPVEPYIREHRTTNTHPVSNKLI